MPTYKHKETGKTIEVLPGTILPGVYELVGPKTTKAKTEKVETVKTPEAEEKIAKAKNSEGKAEDSDSKAKDDKDAKAEKNTAKK